MDKSYHHIGHSGQMTAASPQAQSPENDRLHQYNPAEYGYAYEPQNMPVAPAEGVQGWFDFSNACYLKGFFIGAGATLLLTNSKVQKSLVRGTVKIWSLFQGGVEEAKEQFRDIKAEMSQEK